MSDNEASRQVDNIAPAIGAQQFAVTLDATGRNYDLATLPIGDGTVAPSASGTAGNSGAADEWVYVKLIADVDFYYFFYKDSSLTIDNAAALVAGGTPNGMTANACDLVPAKTAEHVRINRTKHRYLYVKGSGAGTLRLRASSQPSARAGII